MVGKLSHPSSRRRLATLEKVSHGKVYLVGAGPGDPGLITLRGRDCLARADLVLYDYLVNPLILQHAPPSAELECLGKHGSGRLVEQSEINRRLVAEAQAGKLVVRLKGGDPAIFARGAEEAEVLAAANISFEIVPGITAALAAGSYAGIPITHRDLASGVVLVTGQEKAGKVDSAIDFAALAQFRGTIVFYMGVTTAPQWTQQLLRAGKPADTPTAVLRRCSHSDQQIERCRLDEVAELLASSKMRPPAIIILGEVVKLRTTLNWFERRPLFGQTVLVTRPRHQSYSVQQALSELGAQVLLQPAIDISPPDDWQAVDAAIAGLESFDWLVFSSANGVHYFLDRLLQQRDLRALHSAKLAAIGPATCTALNEYHLNADLQPECYRAEALAEALSATAAGSRFLLIRASRGREVLAEQLRAAGGEVEQVVVYRSSDVTAADESVSVALQEGRIDWITVTSSAIARSLCGMFGEDLKRAKLASISPLTSAILRESGVEPTVEAESYTTDGVVTAILDHQQQANR